MADEELEPPEKGELDPNAPAEGDDGQKPTTEEDQPDPIADLAKDLGWTTKDEFKGDPEKWKPADQFIRDGRDIQRSLSSELKEVRSTVANMSRVSQALLDQELKKQEDRLLSQRREAIEAGDVALVDEIDKDRETLRRQVPATNMPPPEVQSFVERNTAWYGKDPVATNFAQQVCELNKTLPFGEQVELAEAEVKKRFPEHFPAQAKQPAQVNAPAARTPGRSKSGKSFHDMPAEAQQAAKDFLERRGVPLEDYTARYWKQQERMVG